MPKEKIKIARWCVHRIVMPSIVPPDCPPCCIWTPKTESWRLTLLTRTQPLTPLVYGGGTTYSMTGHNNDTVA